MSNRIQRFVVFFFRLISIYKMHFFWILYVDLIKIKLDIFPIKSHKMSLSFTKILIFEQGL